MLSRAIYPAINAATMLAISLFTALGISLNATVYAQDVSPQATSEHSSAAHDLVVWCYDSVRDVVVRETASQCHGTVVSDTDAEKVRERRDRETLKAFSAAPPQTEGHTEGLGTGFFVDADGHLLTNNHVVDSCTQIDIEMVDGSTFPASVSAVDVTNDLAILRTAITSPIFARFRSQILDQEGASVAAIGYPDLGLPVREPMITSGIVVASAQGESRDHIVIKADIRGGNSGSPIVDRYGLVVGVIRARLNIVNVYSKTGVLPPDIGIGVALPVTVAFLQKNQIHYLNGRESEAMDSAEILAAARPYMVRVDCRK